MVHFENPENLSVSILCDSALTEQEGQTSTLEKENLCLLSKILCDQGLCCLFQQWLAELQIKWNLNKCWLCTASPFAAYSPEC